MHALQRHCSWLVHNRVPVSFYSLSFFLGGRKGEGSVSFVGFFLSSFFCYLLFFLSLFY